MAVVGYVRVNTDGQSLDARAVELQAAGANTVHREKVSGAVTDRAALKRALASVQAGDVLLVTRLDRLARSTRDLLNTLEALAKKGAAFSLAPGRLGRHVNGAWPSHGDDPRRASRIRARTHPGANW